MFCARCGASNLDFDQFCKSCSSPLTKPGGAYGAGAAPGIPQQPNPYSSASPAQQQAPPPNPYSNPYSSAGPAQQQPPPPNPYSNPYSSAGPAQQQAPPQEYTPYPGYPGVLHPGLLSTARFAVSIRAIASMFLSILSVCIGFYSLIFNLCAILVPVFSISGMILGKMEMNAIRQGKAPQAGGTPAKLGFYIGLISTILFVLGILLIALLIIIGIAGALAS